MDPEVSQDRTIATTTLEAAITTFHVSLPALVTWAGMVAARWCACAA
jgi:hypothetical protein